MEGLSVVKDLREFEAKQESRLAYAKDNSNKDIEKKKKELERKHKAAIGKAQKIKQESIHKAREKAKADSKKIVGEYKEKRSHLKKLFSKNKEKSIEKIFEDIIKENV